MDELKMNLSTKWLKDIVTKLISKVVSEKLGYKAELAKLAKAASLD